MPDDLIRMANQIAANFQAYPEDKVVAEIAGHLHAFWEPRMLADLRIAVAEGRAIGLNSQVITALERL